MLAQAGALARPEHERSSSVKLALTFAQIRLNC